MQQATSEDERFNHIDAADKQSVIEKCATAQKWLDDQTARQAERPKNVDPVLTAADILKKKDEIIYFAVPILTKPKPKPKVESGANTNGTQTPTNESAEGAADKDNNGPPEMDVD